MLFEEYVKYASTWFLENQVEIPKTVQKWQKSSVLKGEIPPKMSYYKLRKDGINIPSFLKAIDPTTNTRVVVYDPITKDNILDIGFIWTSSTTKTNGHRSISVKCSKCEREETLDYGTLQRMKSRKDLFCRYCRNVGGKEKSIEIYDIFEGFKAVERNTDTNINYFCQKCKGIISRTLAHVSNAEYLVCELCTPGVKTKVKDILGNFDSKMELESYKILLKYFSEEEILRQVTYDSLFNTKTKHTLDFYVPSIDLKLEVTTTNNKFALKKYQETKEWKQSFNVIFAYTLKEVEDIVRSYMKI